MTDSEFVSTHWWWISDHFFAQFCKHKAAWEYHCKNNAPQLLMTDELELIYTKTDKPWKFSKEEYDTMIRYGVTDEDIREAWKSACEWGHVSEEEYPCPLP